MTSSEILVALRGMKAGGMLDRDEFISFMQRVGNRYGTGIMSGAAIGSDNIVVKFIHSHAGGHSGDNAADMAFFQSVSSDDRKFFPKSELDEDGFMLQERVSCFDYFTDVDHTKHFPEMLVKMAYKYNLADLHSSNWGVRSNEDGTRNYEVPIIFDVGFRFHYRRCIDAAIRVGNPQSDAIRSYLEDFSCICPTTWDIEETPFWNGIMPDLIKMT